jgi:TRAP-type C4-dicarboxylate transport system permease small subunit
LKDKRIFDRIIGFCAFLAGILLAATVVIVCVEIFMRYFFKSPLTWMVEVCEYFLFSIAFLGAAWLLNKDGHVCVDIVIERMRPAGRTYLVLVSMAIGILVSIVICWFSLVAAWDCYESGVMVVKTFAVSKYYFFLLIFWGYLLLLIEFARKFLHHLRKLSETNS